MNEIIFILRKYFRLYEMGYITEGEICEQCKEVERAMEAISEEQEEILRELYVNKKRTANEICRYIGVSKSGLYRKRKEALYIMCAILNKEIK